MRVIKALKLGNDVVAVLESPLPNVNTVTAAVLLWVANHQDDDRILNVEIKSINVHCKPVLTGDNPEFLATVSGDCGNLEFETVNIPML